MAQIPALGSEDRYGFLWLFELIMNEQTIQTPYIIYRELLQSSPLP